MLLDKAGIKYNYIIASENAELAKSLEVTKAPTLFAKVGGKTVKLENVSDIKKYIEEGKIK